MIIYQATNKINGKYYVGKTTTTLKIRKRKHETSAKNKNEKNHYFHRALIKYGFDNFKWEILEENINNIKILGDMEVRWISDLSACFCSMGYNETLGGDGFILKGHPREKEIRKKRSERIKGEKNPNWGKIGKKHHSWGKKFTEEESENVSKGKTKYIYTFKNPDGKLVKMRSIIKFCKENNLNHGHMYAVKNGKRNHHNGWTYIKKRKIKNV